MGLILALVLSYTVVDRDISHCEITVDGQKWLQAAQPEPGRWRFEVPGGRGSWARVRCVDRAGNWSDPSELAVLHPMHWIPRQGPLQ